MRQPSDSFEIGCQPGQLTGLKASRYGTNMTLAMRTTQWLDSPAVAFIVAARW